MPGAPFRFPNMESWPASWLLAGPGPFWRDPWLCALLTACILPCNDPQVAGLQLWNATMSSCSISKVHWLTAGCTPACRQKHNGTASKGSPARDALPAAFSIRFHTMPSRCELVSRASCYSHLGGPFPLQLHYWASRGWPGQGARRDEGHSPFSSCCCQVCCRGSSCWHRAVARSQPLQRQREPCSPWP